MSLPGRRALFFAILFLLLVGTLEGGLRVLERFSPWVAWILAAPEGPGSIPLVLPDARLGHRPNPAVPGHDAKGFRNPSIPAKARILALGDSQTYGANVGADQAWPRRLESLVGEPVYNMAYGGWGPTHSLQLWDEAMALQPGVVIEALYAGNDFFDAYHHVYNKGQLPELKSDDARVRAALLAAERAEPIAARVSRAYNLGATPPTPPAAPGLLEHSKIHGFLRRCWLHAAAFFKPAKDPWQEARALASRHAGYTQVFADGALKTVFTSEYRLAALDIADPRIAEGLRLSLESIRRMREASAVKGARLLVLLIPTKELVFGSRWHDAPKSFRDLVAAESQAWRATREYLDRHGIAYVDALPGLRAELDSGVQPYPVNQDGHPNPGGHLAIARAVAAKLR